MKIENNSRIVIDIDGVLAQKNPNKEYENLEPDKDVLRRLREYDDCGFYIILHTARNMRTYEGRIGKISANTAPVLVDWLEEYDIPYDELRFGKPWCGHEGFYIDDRAVRPQEFLEKDHGEILKLIDKSVRREPNFSDN